MKIPPVRSKKIARITADTSFFFLGNKRDNKKVRREKNNKDKKDHYKGKKKAIGREKVIFKISFYHYMIYKWVD